MDMPWSPINIILNKKKEKGNEKKMNIKVGGGQTDSISERIQKSYITHLIKTVSKYIDNKIQKKVSAIWWRGLISVINDEYIYINIK